jgi:hypothetical protein
LRGRLPLNGKGYGLPIIHVSSVGPGSKVDEPEGLPSRSTTGQDAPSTERTR